MDDGNNTNPEKVAEDDFLAMAFIECADPVRYKTLLSILRNNSFTGEDHYPKTLTDSFISYTYHPLGWRWKAARKKCTFNPGKRY